MKTITVKNRQTIYDVAIEQYGTPEAVVELLALNPSIANDPAELMQLGIDSMEEERFYLDVALASGAQLRIDEESLLIRRNTLRDLTTEITTYEYGPND